MRLLRKLIKLIAKPTISPIANDYRGAVGERKVDAKLNPIFFGKVEHRQIDDLILVDERGKSHQIDHIEIRENGIFCIETKNYKGWIWGSENQTYWTQTLYNKEKHQFYNPIKQNQSHIYHISKVLGKNYKVNSLVVMVQNNSGRIDCPNVIDLNDLRDYLKNYDDGTRYSIEEMDFIHKKLLSAHTQLTKREHVQNIKQTQLEVQKGICPRCGKVLVQKKSKYGSFMGCSGYPNCKFILKENR